MSTKTPLEQAAFDFVLDVVRLDYEDAVRMRERARVALERIEEKRLHGEEDVYLWG